MKTCTKCGETQPLSSFYGDVSRGGKIHPWCKSCVKKRQREYNAAHRQENNERSRRCRAKNGRTYDLRKHYGIDSATYEAMFNAQGGVCAICGTPPLDDKKRRLAVDHDHSTGRNRGLLCAICNHALQRIETDPDWGTKALNYLARYIEQTVKG